MVGSTFGLALGLEVVGTGVVCLTVGIEVVGSMEMREKRNG